MTTPQDLDHLSAYLDDRLAPDEKARLEARLAHEPELKSALADLQLTVRLLRSLPTVKPPRNFTVTRAQAEAIRGPRRSALFPVLRLATALAALALIVVIAGDLDGGLFSGGSRAAAPAAPEVMMQSAATGAESATAAPTAAPPMALALAPTEPPSPTLVAAAPMASAPVAEAGKAVETTTPERGIAAALATHPPNAGGGGGGGGGNEATPSATETPPGAQARTIIAPTEIPAAADLAVAASPTKVAPAPQVEAPPIASAPQSAPPIRYVEIGLALLTTLLALAAWLTRRS